MISVEEAHARIAALVAPVGTENVPLAQADERVLRCSARAQRDQPPFAAAAMDGYAVAGPVAAGQRFSVIGAAPAGCAFGGQVGAGQAVRIFTGAPIPHGADCILIQEDVRREGETITATEPAACGEHIRPLGGDFVAGDTLAAPRRLRPVDLGLLAAMNCADVTVSRRPVVAIIATGDELVMPGEDPRADQIIASNAFALAAMARAEGAQARLLPIARDTPDSLRSAFALARGADLIVTIGGASVGDHDLVGPVARELGAERAFYKIAMRPGKPLMAGRLGSGILLGLPGNPVSSIVCGHIFMLPVIRGLLGLGCWPATTHSARLSVALPANGSRAHYMRATLEPGDDGPSIRAQHRQDSSLLSVLVQSDALLVRPAHAPAASAGSTVRYIPI